MSIRIQQGLVTGSAFRSRPRGSLLKAKSGVQAPVGTAARGENHCGARSMTVHLRRSRCWTAPVQTGSPAAWLWQPGPGRGLRTVDPVGGEASRGAELPGVVPAQDADEKATAPVGASPPGAGAGDGCCLPLLPRWFASTATAATAAPGRHFWVVEETNGPDAMRGGGWRVGR